MLRSKKPKSPENVADMWSGGYGLWAIWHDHGEGTPAQPVRDLLHIDLGMGVGKSPVVFLYDGEAYQAAVKLALRYPRKRFCVKQHYSS